MPIWDGVMAAYDPETLNVMRDALDQAWALLPQDCKSKFLKVDMADRVLRKAADGERDPAVLRAAALIGTGIDGRIDRPPPEFSK
jgi:hypothetical protein